MWFVPQVGFEHEQAYGNEEILQNRINHFVILLMTYKELKRLYMFEAHPSRLPIFL